MEVPVEKVQSLISELITLCSPQVVGVKMDIEGAEFRVLDGETLRDLAASSAILHLSVHPGAGHAHAKPVLARGLWRFMALLSTLRLIFRIKRYATVRAEISELHALPLVGILRRLDGPEKTLVCDFSRR